MEATNRNAAGQTAARGTVRSDQASRLNFTTIHDARNAFADAMREHGHIVDDVIADGHIHRCRVEGDRHGQQSGAYVLHADDRPAGWYLNWKTGESHSWTMTDAPLTKAERERMRESWAQAKRHREVEREQAHRGALTTAQRLWRLARPANPQHGYLAAKGVGAYGIRQLGDMLIVPMRDADGTLWSFQKIAPCGGVKRFLAGGRKHGLYHAIGPAVDSVLGIVEGYATGASVLEATGLPVAIAFDAGNLLPVAQALRTKFPAAKIIVCADNDAETEERTGTNPGRHYAERAARAVGAAVAIPGGSA